MNTQPWEIFVVTGQKKEELAVELFAASARGIPPRPDFPFPEFWPETLQNRLQTHRFRRLAALGIDLGDREQIEAVHRRNFKFFDAPCVVFIGMEESLTAWSLFDLGLFVHGFLMALHAADLGGCPQAALAAYPALVRQKLGIAENIKIVLGVSLGYPDPQAPINNYKSQRINVNDFVRWHD